MDDKRIHPTTDRIQRELNRLRAARPEMDSRIDRAEHILVTQLSVSNGTRPVRVRLSENGHTYTVRSGSKLSKTYTVDPATCRTCKHILACYVLERASQFRGEAA